MLVVKRDGHLEPFEPHKVLRVAKAAGLTEEQAAQVGKEIETWLNSLKAESVSVKLIRDKMAEELAKHNRYAADLYVWYERTKKTNSNTSQP